MAIEILQQSDVRTYINVINEGVSGSPIGFKNIVNYFIANPKPTIKFPARGDLCEKQVAWVSGGDVGTSITDTVDKIAGTASIKVVKTGNGGFTIEYRTSLDPDKISGANNYINAGSAEKIMFALKSNNPNIILTTIEFRENSGTGLYPFTYTNDGNGWKCETGNWENKIIDIRTEWATRNITRAPFSAIGFIKLTFTGGDIDDIVNIDELRLELPDPNPREITPKLFFFPLPLYIANCYFKDAGFTFICNFIYDGGIYGSIIMGMNNLQMELGTTTEGGTLYINPICVDNAGRNLNLTNGILKGLTFISSEAEGYSITVYSALLSNVQIEDCNFYNLADMTVGGLATMKNVIIGRSRYALRGAPSVLNDFKYYYYSYGSGYAWFAEADNVVTKGIKPIGFPSNTNFLVSRNYKQNKSYNHYFIDLDLSETDGKMNINIYDAFGYPFRQILQYTVNLSFSDSNGVAISNANVVIKNKLNEVVFTGSTDINGKIPEQVITGKYNEGVNINLAQYNLSWNPKTEGVSLSPFTITATKEGYQDYQDTFNITGKIEWEIALTEEIPPVYINGILSGDITSTDLQGTINTPSINGELISIDISGSIINEDI